jgi:hypothetical protein
MSQGLSAPERRQPGLQTRRVRRGDSKRQIVKRISFSLDGYDVDGISVWSVVVAEPPLFRQHFFPFVGVIALEFYLVRKRLASFFSVFSTRPVRTGRIFATGERKGPDANGDRGVYHFYAAEWSFKDIAAFDCECTLSEK